MALAVQSNRDRALIEAERRIKARQMMAAYLSYAFPRFHTSAFSDAVCAALDKFLADVQAGLRPVLVLQAPPQHGKLIADHVPVLTAEGWKTHGDLVPGDAVFHPSGRTVKVVARSEKAPADMRVELGNGEVIYCHERHEWTVYNRNKKRVETLETARMLENGKRSGDRSPLYTGEVGKRGCHFTYKLPAVAPLQGAHADLPVHPYALGVWLGDGTQTKPAITYDAKDAGMAEELESLGYPAKATHIHKTTGVLTTYFNDLKNGLIECGVFAQKCGVRNKHIPDAYLCASINQRLDLLAGLIDTDGYTYQKNGRVVFTTSDLRLADTFCELISTFGWSFSKVTEQPKMSSSGIQGVAEYYVIGFNPTLGIPCRLKRKMNTPGGSGRRVAIRDVRHDPQGYTGHCIQVDSPDGLYLVGRTMQPTHNSELVSRRFPAYIMGRFPDWRIGAASYAVDLAGAMSQDVRRNIASPDHLRLFPAKTNQRLYLVNRALEFSNPNGAGSYLGVGVGGGLTGRPADIIIIDDPVKNAEEALSQTTKEGHWNWYQSVVTTRLSENSGQIIMATSWAEDDLPARIIKQFDGDPRLTVLRFPAINSPDESGFQPHMPLGALVPGLKSLAFLREQKALLSDYWWSAMYQQSAKSLGGNVFKELGIRFYLPKDLPERLDRVVNSWDCTFKDTDGTDFVVGQVWGKRGSDAYLLDQARDRMSFTATVKAVVAMRNKWVRTQNVLIEDKANGPAVIDVLKTQVPGLKPIEPDGSKLARAHSVTHVWEAGNIYLPHPDVCPWVKALISELTAFPAGANDDQVDALTQALRFLYPPFERIAISAATLALFGAG